MENTKKAGCVVIYGGTREERQHIAEGMLKDHPELAMEDKPAFSRVKKIGPFQKENRKSMYQIFMDSPVIKRDYRDSLLFLFELLGVTKYMDRPMFTLPAREMALFSMLYDILHGKRKAVLLRNDGEFEDDIERNCRFAACLNSLTEDGQIIWITEKPYACFLREVARLLDAWLLSSQENNLKDDTNQQAIDLMLLKYIPHFGAHMKVVGEQLDPEPALESDEREAAIRYQATWEFVDLLLRKWESAGE